MMYSNALKDSNYFIVDDLSWLEDDRIVNFKFAEKIYNYVNYVADFDNYLMYISDRNTLLPEQKNSKLIFKKNKIYKIEGDTSYNTSIVICKDESGQKFNIMDVCWEIFKFFKEKDKLKVERQLKIKKLDNDKKE